MKSFIGIVVCVILLAYFFTSCSDFHFFTTDELNIHEAKIRAETSSRLSNELAQEMERRKAQIREEARRELIEEIDASKRGNNLRSTRWGMTQDEVIAAEGTPLQRNDSSLVYKVHTAGLPTVLRYKFEGGILVKADIHFSNPKLASALPPKTASLVEADFWRMYNLFTEKYGSAQVTTQQFSRIEDLLRKQERLNDSLTQYQRQRNDLQRDYDRRFKELWKKYEGWRDREHQVKKHLADKEKQAQRLDDWITEIKRQQADIEPIIREERYNERDGKLPQTTVCRWYEPSRFDITLSWSSSPQGSLLVSHYNGFITPSLSAAPSDF